MTLYMLEASVYPLTVHENALLRSAGHAGFFLRPQALC